MRSLPVICLLLISANGSAQDRYLIDWDAVGEESLQHLVELVKINTTNPPGGETQAANYVKAVLASEGIESKLYSLDPVHPPSLEPKMPRTFGSMSSRSANISIPSTASRAKSS